MAGYSGYRKVPRKVMLVGDFEQGKKLIGEADSQLRILEQQMTFQGLKQSYRTIRPRPGIIITCWSCFTLQGVRIITGGGKGIIEETLRECWCNCNFSIGQIIELTGGLNGESVEELEDHSVRVYSVKACNHRDHYVLYENTLASDFTVYAAGDVVVLMAYKDKRFLCHSGGEITFGCSPRKVVLGDDETVAEMLAEDSWRTAYRIIPVCAELFKKWITTNATM